MTQNENIVVRSGRVAVGDAEVAHTVTGTGPGLVLVHGAGASKDTNWGPLTERLRDRFTVVAMDLSGSGETTDGGGPIEIESLVDQVSGVARAADLSSYHLVGYSLGSEVAAAVAAQHPGEVESVVLVAGWPESGLRERCRFDLWQRLIEVDRELFVRFLLFTGMSPAFFVANTDETLEQAVQELLPTLAPGTDRQAVLGAKMNLRPLLGSITAPTLVVGMTHDQMVFTEQARELAEAIEGAEYNEIEAGHLAPWETPEAFVEVIEGFLAREH